MAFYLANECLFKLGDGKGDDEIEVDAQTEQDCAQECIAMKAENPLINGVSFGVFDDGPGIWYIF